MLDAITADVRRAVAAAAAAISASQRSHNCPPFSTCCNPSTCQPSTCQPATDDHITDDHPIPVAMPSIGNQSKSENGSSGWKVSSDSLLTRKSKRDGITEICIDRRTKLGNPVSMGESGHDERYREQVCQAHRQILAQLPTPDIDAIAKLHGVHDYLDPRYTTDSSIAAMD